MKKQFVLLIVYFMMVSCGQTVTASPIPSATVVTTLIPSPSQIPTETIDPTPRPTYVQPTLIPTINPTNLPDLLRNAFSIHALSDVNGYNIRKITGWENGFGTSASWYVYCPSYVWLDSNHILLYPIAGQITHPIDMEMRIVGVVPQPVVTNLTSGAIWLPPVNTLSGALCNSVDWSRELDILIIPQLQNKKPTVSTYTYEGNKLATYPGEITDVSPRGTKILMEDGTVIDLQTNKKIVLNWDLDDYLAPPPPSEIYWTSDETRVYQCCYLFADLAKGTSFRFTESDFLDSQGNPLNYEGLWMYRGNWVLDDTYFLVEWSWGEDGDIRYLPMFDPATRTIFDVRRLAGISSNWTCYQTNVSPDGKYVWMAGADGSYLIDLFTFESHFYPGQDYFYTDWSPNSNFIWAYSHKYNILSIADKGVRSPPIYPLPESEHLWHPADNVVVYPAKDKNALIFLDVSTMSFRELPFKDQSTSYKISNLAWSPDGEKIAFVTDNSSLWQVDYPSLENLENIISSKSISSVNWSPDGSSIAFISGPNIYIAEIKK